MGLPRDDVCVPTKEQLGFRLSVTFYLKSKDQASAEILTVKNVKHFSVEMHCVCSARSPLRKRLLLCL